MKRIVIAGGSGLIGRGLQRVLLEQGYSLTIISRNPEKINKTERVDAISWNDVQQTGLPQCESVVQVAGEPLDPKRSWQDMRRELYESRVITTLILRNAIARLHAKYGADSQAIVPRTFVVVTGTMYYKPDRQANYDEECEGGSTSISSAVKDYESAARFDTAFKASIEVDGSVTEKVNCNVDNSLKADVHTVALRAGLVLAPDGGQYLERRSSFRYGFGSYFGDGEQPTSFIHVEDLSNLILFSILHFGRSEQRSAAFTAINAVSPQPCTSREFADAFARSEGHRRAYIWLPRFLVRLLLWEELADLMLEGQRVYPKRALALGFTFRFPDIDSVFRDLAKQSCVKS